MVPVHLDKYEALLARQIIFGHGLATFNLKAMICAVCSAELIVKFTLSRV